MVSRFPILAIAVILTARAGWADFALDEGFARPPASARPYVWYHLMNGNVTKDGVTRDFEALAKANVGGVQMFDAGCGIPAGPVAFDSPAWYDLLRHVAKEARRLGLSVTLANCSGWSSSGGPWVAPSNAMKRLVFAETRLSGPCRFDGVLPRFADDNGFYADIATVAFPVPAADQTVLPPVSTDIDGTTATATAAEPFAAAGFSYRLQYGGCWTGTSRVDVEADDGTGFREVESFRIVLGESGGVDKSLRYHAFGRPVRARSFRIRFRPTFAWAPNKRLAIETLRMESGLRIADLGAKTFQVRNTIMEHPVESSPDQVVRSEAVMDLTKAVAPDGRLAWSVPSGNWAVLRVGCVCNGVRNRPASRTGEGLETDKLSSAATDLHFNSYIGRVCDELGDLAGDVESGVNGVLIDSYEVGAQNWTPGLEREFAVRTGYSLVPYLPAFAGYVVDSARRSEAVLGDFRKTVSDLFCENYADRFAALCRKRGLTLSLEPYGNGPFDGFRYGRAADVPMGEVWSNVNAGDHVVDTRNARYAASVAHVYGRRVVGMEAFTCNSAGGARWLTMPFGIKAQGDRLYAEGVNRLYFHRFAHQPWTDPRYVPGMTMGAHGMHLDRTQTWWPITDTWFEYLSRCQWMLQSGEPVTDVLMAFDEETPAQTGNTDGTFLRPPAVPFGFACDYAPKGLAGQVSSRYRVVLDASRPEGFADALAAAGLSPDFDGTAPESSGGMAYAHRRGQGADWYFVALNNPESCRFDVSFRIADRIPEIWDPETGLIADAENWRVRDGRTCVTLDFKPSGSTFVVFRRARGEVESASAPPYSFQEIAVPENAWSVTFSGVAAPAPCVFERLISWTDHRDEAVRHFSGTAAYEARLKLPGQRQGRIVLDLGEVRDFAQVEVNGLAYPALWRPPYRVDITDAVDPQGDSLKVRVRVTNRWPNRLIGDDFLPDDCQWNDDGSLREIPKWVLDGKPSPTGRHTFTTWKHWKKTDALLPSGLLGPVRLLHRIRKP